MARNTKRSDMVAGSVPGSSVTPLKVLGSLLQKERNAHGGFDMYSDESPPEIFADSMNQLALGPFQTRLTFTRLESVYLEDGKTIEQRRVNLNLVMPTPSLLQLIGIIIQAIQQNSTAFSQQAEKYSGDLASMNEDDLRRKLIQLSMIGEKSPL